MLYRCTLDIIPCITCVAANPQECAVFTIDLPTLRTDSLLCFYFLFALPSLLCQLPCLFLFLLLFSLPSPLRLLGFFLLLQFDLPVLLNLQFSKRVVVSNTNCSCSSVTFSLCFDDLVEGSCFGNFKSLLRLPEVLLGCRYSRRSVRPAATLRH